MTRLAQGRREPALGPTVQDLPAARARPAGVRAVRRGPRRRVATVLALLALILIALGMVRFRDQLAAWWPQDQVSHLLDAAERALAEGRLAGDGHSRGAEALFLAVQAISPDDLRARDGLLRVGEAWLARADAALAAGQSEPARAALEAARRLGVPAARIDALEARLRGLVDGDAQLQEWLERAGRAEQVGRLADGEDSALAWYRRVLEQDPGNALARAGIGEVLGRLAGEARSLLATGQLEAARERIRRIADVEPAQPDLPGLQAVLAEAMAARRAERERKLAQAEVWLAQGRLLEPAGANALEQLRQVLEEEPGNARARQGLARLAATLLAQFERAAADFDIERAEALLVRLEANGLLDPQGRSRARARLQQAARRAEALARVEQAGADPERVRRLLEQAAQALARGDLWAPPGLSAWDTYRQVQRLDPHNAEAERGLAALPARAVQGFEAALREGRLARARGYVEGLEASAVSVPELPAMKRRLSQAYAGHAAERLGAGERAAARAAFEHARELDPDNPDLVSLQARLEAAGA